MKEGGGLECHIPILKKWFFLKTIRIIPWLWKRVLHLVWALYYVYLVVEMTLNLANSWQFAAGAADECQFWTNYKRT